MDNIEKAAALEDLISQGMGSDTRTYNFETPISKLLGKAKYQVSATVPKAVKFDEAKLVAEALGKSLMSMVSRALDIEIRMVYVEIDKEGKMKVEAERLKAIM